MQLNDLRRMCFRTRHTLNLLSHLPPYSGAMKCMFFMLSRHVLTWWWIASGATAERNSKTHKVRLCIQLCLHGWGCSRSPPPSHPPICCPILHTKTPVGFWRQLILPTFGKNSRPSLSTDLCHRWHAVTPHDRARPMFLCARQRIRQPGNPSKPLKVSEPNPPRCMHSPWSPVLKLGLIH